MTRPRWLKPVNKEMSQLYEAIHREIGIYPTSVPDEIFLNVLFALSGNIQGYDQKILTSLMTSDSPEFCLIDYDMNREFRSNLLNWLWNRYGEAVAEQRNLPSENGMQRTVALRIPMLIEKVLPDIRNTLQEELDSSPFAEYLKNILRYQSGFSVSDPNTIIGDLDTHALCLSGVARVANASMSFAERLEMVRFDLIKALDGCGIRRSDYLTMINAVNETIDLYAAAQDKNPENCLEPLKPMIEKLAIYPLVPPNLSLIAGPLSLWHDALGDRDAFAAAASAAATASTRLISGDLQKEEDRQAAFEKTVRAMERFSVQLSEAERPMFSKTLEWLDEFCIDNIREDPGNQFSPVFQRRFRERSVLRDQEWMR